MFSGFFVFGLIKALYRTHLRISITSLEAEPSLA